ncbi:PucR family transcriptional regulator [Gephyromycinifex aptenodytis]|uniref:PucR family transcriptional regulator n=1 Tax=Gephyromycinifex aptenodytis TaxID=2716227 RepID=UPI001446FFF9|nr:helix-turn-helix domain-containing protein [Gephyromycinifex aptenodytis]
MHTDCGANAARWRVVVEALRVQIPSLVEEFIESLAVLEPYRSGLVPRERIEADGRASFEYLVNRLAEHCGPTRVITDPAQSLGRDRARRGVPLGALMAAIHIDVSLLWNRLRTQIGDEDAALLVEHVEVLLSVVDEYGRNVQDAYLHEEAVMVQQGDHELDTLLARLLDGQDDDELLDAVAQRLGASPSSPLLVMAAPVARRESLWSFYRECWAQQQRPHWLARAQDVVLLMSLEAPAADVLDRARSVHAALVPLCPGVKDLPGAVALARTLAEVLPRGCESAFTLRQGWLAVATAGLGQVAPFLVQEVFAGLLTRPEAEQERLLETADVYLACGSVARTAQLGYCHRNTVVNRLARLRALTGLDLSVPQEAALFLTARSALACGPGHLHAPSA